MVYEWTDKAEGEGCGVVIVSETTGEWTIHYIVLARANEPIVRARWVSGTEWGEDSPEGDVPEHFNAYLDAHGRVVSL